MIKFSKFLENKNINEGLLDAASRFGKHIVQGGREAMDAISGPAAKFDASLKSIEDLVASLEKNPKLKNYPALTKQGATLTQYLRAITRVLRREKDNLPELRSGDSQYNPRYEQAPGAPPTQGTPPTGDMRRVV
jgi:hypothetical protein